MVASNINGEEIRSEMFIKSARNAGLSVHVPSNNEFTTVLRDKSREFSAYIPGLAGIPLEEEEKSKLIVHNRAAAGDANTALRNILLLLQNREYQNSTELNLVEDYVQKIMGLTSLTVDFDDSKDKTIQVYFQTQHMKKDDPKKRKPIELLGVGFLQIIQIFAYLVYFKPRLLLVDEPDSHLYPGVQEKLVQTLVSAADSFDSQVILSTHSPSVIRSLPLSAKLLWMESGKIKTDSEDTIRAKMGW